MGEDIKIGDFLRCHRKLVMTDDKAICAKKGDVFEIVGLEGSDLIIMTYCGQLIASKHYFSKYKTSGSFYGFYFHLITKEEKEEIETKINDFLSDWWK